LVREPAFTGWVLLARSANGEGHRDPVGLGNTILGVLWQSDGDVVLVDDSAEDLLPADPELSEVDGSGG
jgi:hypothetical protein